MCRWFAYVSPSEDCLLEDVLVTPTHSLTRQVNERYLPQLLSHDPNRATNERQINARNALLNIDGLGVAWYTTAQNDFIKDCSGLRPALYKTVSPPLNDFNFRTLCRNTATKACFAHIRAASGTPIAVVNNHPFTFGRHVFMHNGVVSDFLAIRRPLSNLLSDAAFANVHGGTDSEHLAALYMTYLCEDAAKAGASMPDLWEEEFGVEQMRDALHRTIATTIELQEQILGPAHAQANSLNLAVTDGRQMVACRFRNHVVEVPPSLYYSTHAGVTLNRKYPDHPDDGLDNSAASMNEEEHGKHVIIASEPTTYKLDDWKLVEPNCWVLVDREGELQEQKMQFEAGLFQGGSK